jgi:hypothetical protein
VPSLPTATPRVRALKLGAKELITAPVVVSRATIRLRATPLTEVKPPAT